MNNPSLPSHVFSPFWADWTRKTAQRQGVPVDYVCAGLIAAVVSLAARRVVAEPIPGWREPLALWLCLVGGKEAGKTRCLDALHALLDEIEDAPEGGGGGLEWQDDLRAWLKGLGRKADDRARWLGGWDRKGLGLAGTLRPETLAEAGRDDSVAERLLFFWPDELPPTPLWQRQQADEPADATPYLGRIAGLLGGRERPLALPFSAEAVEAFDIFRTHHRDDIGKPCATVARIAALLTLLDWSESGGTEPPAEIDDDAVSRAIALWQHYLAPQMALALERTAALQRQAPVDRVLRWLRETGVESVSRQELRRKALAERVDTAETASVIAELEERGVLVPIPRVENPGVGRPSPRWSVCLRISESPKFDAPPAPPQKRGVQFDMPPIRATQDLLPALAAVTAATAQGTLTPLECRQMASVVDIHMEVIAATEFEQRLVQVEAAAAEMKGVREALERLRRPDGAPAYRP